MGWQDFVATGIVLGALAYLLSLVVGGVRRRKSGQGCGASCGKCSSGQSPARKVGVPAQLVEIGLMPPGPVGVTRSELTSRSTSPPSTTGPG